ncbi:hypothetical protein DICVIV_05132 [Dictyocaulus viviparus]|uniref:F-box domain-containing protein n=1 Tax=Dictyocaulus viviparus TaxID=29172 RepID=A0A0D8XVU9_DICVI|nr:hypothetical protein DICVIV_05132 [Dictyocaulus viviparus]
MIIESYGFSRLERVRRRDGLHPSHPVLPLREIRDYNGVLLETTEFSNSENSSDEEIRIKVDPSSQHLHTLGNESAKYEETKRVTKRWEQLDSFHKIYNLQQFTCLKNVRRVEYAEHHVSQHINSLSDLVVRCPNWQRGCTFYTKRLQPKYGILRFLPSSSSISFLPSYSNHCEDISHACSLDTLPTWLMITLLEYLPNSAIRALSQTSRTSMFFLRSLRSAIFTFAQDRAMTSIIWKKCEGCWIEGGIAIDFSVAEKSPEFSWGPAEGLSNHLAHCCYNDKVEYSEVRVPVFYSNLRQITDEFMRQLQYFD